MNTPRHQMTQIPEGVAVNDFLPSFASVRRELRTGTPNPECPSCHKPFGVVRKRRKSIRMYPLGLMLPVVFMLDVCGRCYALHQQGGAARDDVLAAIEAYRDGVEANR